MNKTQFYALSSALLASTALTSGASAGTIGKYDATGVFTTSALAISNSIFSTTASTANSVVVGEGQLYTSRLGMAYTNQFAGTTRWTTEFTATGARFITSNLSSANVNLMFAATTSGTTTGSMGGTPACASLTALATFLVANDCSLSGVNFTGYAVGIALSGVTFNNASGLATAGTSIGLTGTVYNPTNNTQVYEAATSGNVITSRVPITIAVTAGANVTASATSTPIAFSELTTANSGLSMSLFTLAVTGTGSLGNALTTAIGATQAVTTTLSIASSIFSSGAVRNVTVAGTSYTTATNFSGGTVTFSATSAGFDYGTNLSFSVTVQFMGTTAIPAAVAGTVTGSMQGGTSAPQAIAISGSTAAVSQAGFRAEVNTFNASTNGPFGSYLRIHNNGNISGTVTITVRNDATGAMLGSAYTTAAIAPNSTVQFAALAIEDGASVPTADRTGSYTLSIAGPLTGYVQHILFDGNSVADLSGYRNSGNTSNQP